MSLNLIPPSGTTKSVDGLKDVSKVAVVASVSHCQYNRYTVEIIAVVVPVRDCRAFVAGSRKITCDRLKMIVRKNSVMKSARLAHDGGERRTNR